MSNSPKSDKDLLIRIYFDDDHAPVRRTVPIFTPAWFNCEEINFFDIELRDEFGDLFYVPNHVINFDFTLIMYTKI